MFTILSLVGYTKTGKDEFAKDVIEKKLQYNQVIQENVKWIIYSKGHQDLPKFLGCSVKRYAFADALKIFTHEKLGLQNCAANTFENVKDSCWFFDPENPEKFNTIRDYYKFYGDQEKVKNPFIWRDIVSKQMETDSQMKTDSKLNNVAIITDFRYPCEVLENQISLRLFRSVIPIPHPDIHSEHDLDKLMTDYILVPYEQDFQTALYLFPQYADFKPMGCLVHGL